MNKDKDEKIILEDDYLDFHVLNELQKISFLGIEKINSAAALYQEYRAATYCKTFQELCESVFSLLIRPRYSSKIKVINRNSETGVILSSCVLGRGDMKRMMSTLANLSECTYIESVSNNEYFHFRETVYVLIWIFQMRHLHLPFKEKAIYANSLMSGLRCLHSFKQIPEVNMLKRIVTLNDLCVDDYFKVLYCKKRGIKTVTLQHGVMEATKADLHFIRLSPSEQFVSYGSYYKELYEKKAHTEVIALGCPMLVLQQRKLGRPVKSGRFIVALGNSASEPCEEMVRTCVEYAKSNSLKMDVKMHPVDETKYRETYKKMLAGIGEVLPKGVKTDNLFETYDFAICHRSTMMLQFLYSSVPVYLFSPNRLIAKLYPDFPLPTFENAEELKDKTETCYVDENLFRVTELLCGEGDISEKYILFLKEDR